MTVSGTDYLLTFPSVAGKHYTVEYSAVLPAENWQFVQTGGNPATGIVGTGNPIQVADSGGAIHGKRFYRIRVGP